MQNPLYYFQTGYRRLKRFIAWAPILWKDEDWEPEHLFEIMRFKISRMRQEMERTGYHVGYEKDVRDMKVAEELLRRCAFSDFYYDWCEDITNKEKEGKCTCPEEKYTTVPCDYDSEGNARGSLWVNLSCGFCKSAFSRWVNREDAKRKEDFEYLFKHLKKNVKQWWD